MIEIKKLFTVPFFLRSIRASDPLPSPPEMGRWWLLPRVGQAFDPEARVYVCGHAINGNGVFCAWPGWQALRFGCIVQ